jgi:hypothetical protein
LFYFTARLSCSAGLPARFAAPLICSGGNQPSETFCHACGVKAGEIF